LNKRERKEKKIRELCVEGLNTDGAHHKQWYLEEILKVLGYNPKDLKTEYEIFCDISWEEGIPP